MPKILDEIEATRIGSVQLVKKNKFDTLQSRFSRSYYVLSDNTTQSEDDIFKTTGVPQMYSILGGAWCIKQDAKELATIGSHPSTGNRCILYEVRCDFDSDANVEEANQSPVARTPKVSWSGVMNEVQLFQDPVTGAAIVNAVGDRLEVTTQIPSAILEIRRYEYPPFNPLTQLSFAGKTNSGVFYGAPTGCALMAPITAGEEQVVDKVRVVEVTYQIHFRLTFSEGGSLQEDGWAIRPLNYGYHYREGDGGSGEPGPLQVSTDKYGNPKPTNLRLDGTKIPDTVEGLSELTYMTYNQYPKADFNLLNLGPF